MLSKLCYRELLPGDSSMQLLFPSITSFAAHLRYQGCQLIRLSCWGCISGFCQGTSEPAHCYVKDEDFKPHTSKYCCCRVSFFAALVNTFQQDCSTQPRGTCAMDTRLFCCLNSCVIFIRTRQTSCGIWKGIGTGLRHSTHFHTQVRPCIRPGTLIYVTRCQCRVAGHITQSERPMSSLDLSHSGHTLLAYIQSLSACLECPFCIFQSNCEAHEMPCAPKRQNQALP